MGMRRTGWRAAVAATALAVVMTGCGGSSGGADRLAPQAALAAAVEQTQEVDSYRYSLTSTTKASGQVIEVNGSGVTRSDGSAGEMTFTLPLGAGEVRQRIVDDVLYMELPQQPGVFYELQVSDLVDTSLAGSTDPTAGLKALRDVSGDVTEVGREEVRGEQTTRYSGTMDARQALEALQGPLRELLEQVLTDSDAEAVPFDAWIDDEGRIRRLDQTLSLELPQMQDESVEVTSRLEMYDFGVDVQVEAPPADAVRDGQPLLDSLRAGPGSAPAS